MPLTLHSLGSMRLGCLLDAQGLCGVLHLLTQQVPQEHCQLILAHTLVIVQVLHMLVD